jgi:hypothetical protein
VGVEKGLGKEILPRQRWLRSKEKHVVAPDLSCPKHLRIRVVSPISTAVVKMTIFVWNIDLCRNAQARSATSTINSQSVKTALHCLPCLNLPSVTLHVVEVTFSAGFESHSLRHIFNHLGCLRDASPFADSLLGALGACADQSVAPDFVRRGCETY